MEWEAEDVAPFTPTKDPEGGGGIGNPAGEDAVVGSQHGRLATATSETTTPTHVQTPSTISTPPSPPPKSPTGENIPDDSSSSSDDSDEDEEGEGSKISKHQKHRSSSGTGTWASSMMQKLKALAPNAPGSDFRGRPPERVAHTEQRKKEKQRSATMSIIEGEAIYKYSGLATTSTFWRFLIEVPVNLDPTRGMKVHYAINKKQSNLDLGHNQPGATDITFHIAPTGSDMRFAAYSCNGFSEGIDPNTFKGEGFDSGFDPVWADLLQRHEERPFHALVGGGDQIYCDTYVLYS